MKRLAVLTGIVFAITGTSTAEASTESSNLKKKITSMIVNTHNRQYVMGTRYTPTRLLYKHRHKLTMLRQDFRWWSRKASEAYKMFVNPPYKSDWFCIHRYEGSWSDSDDPYWGGLQMDRGFMRTYAPRILLKRGLANVWSPLEQIWVAERARRSGRGFGPWPNTAHYCGLL